MDGSEAGGAAADQHHQLGHPDPARGHPGAPARRHRERERHARHPARLRLRLAGPAVRARQPRQRPVPAGRRAAARVGLGPLRPVPLAEAGGEHRGHHRRAPGRVRPAALGGGEPELAPSAARGRGTGRAALRQLQHLDPQRVLGPEARVGLVHDRRQLHLDRPGDRSAEPRRRYVWDKSQQGRVFGKVDVDFNDRDHLTTLLAYSHNQFQIPVDPTQSARGDRARRSTEIPPSPYFPPNSQQTERENDLFGIVSYRHDFDTAKSLRVAAFVRYSTASFFGDPCRGARPGAGALHRGHRVPRGEQPRSAGRPTSGLVADYLQRIGDQHTLKFGLALNQLWGTSTYQAYSQLVTPPPPYYGSVGQGSDSPTNTTGGAYVQDRWTARKADADRRAPGGLPDRLGRRRPATTEVGVSPAARSGLGLHPGRGGPRLRRAPLDAPVGARRRGRRAAHERGPAEPAHPVHAQAGEGHLRRAGHQGAGDPRAVARAQRSGDASPTTSSTRRRSRTPASPRRTTSPRAGRRASRPRWTPSSPRS